MLQSRKSIFKSVREDAITVATIAAATAAIIEVTIVFILAVTAEVIIEVITQLTIVAIRAVTRAFITQRTLVPIIAVIAAPILGVIILRIIALTAEVTFAGIAAGSDTAINDKYIETVTEVIVPFPARDTYAYGRRTGGQGL